MTVFCNSRKRGCPKDQPQVLPGLAAAPWNEHTYCQLPAGWGTDHPGSGRCKLHGGNHRAGPAHPRWRHGRYAESVRAKLPNRLREVYVASLEDSELLSHRADLALLSVRKLQLLEGLDEGRDNVWPELLKTIETSRRVGAAERERLVQLERMISVEDLDGIIRFLTATVHAALSEHVADSSERNGVLDYLASELRVRGELVEARASADRSLRSLSP